MAVDTIKTNEEGSQTFLFPDGIEAFAKKYNADVIHVYDDTIQYYDGDKKLWIVLDDEVKVSPVSLASRGNKSSTLSAVDKPE